MILLIDNYDSFTYNLYHYLGELGADVKVFRNNKITLDEIEALQPEKIVISQRKRAFPAPRSRALARGSPFSASAWDTRQSARHMAARSCARRRSCTANCRM